MRDGALRELEYKHLPEYLQEVSKPFYDLAHEVAFIVPDADKQMVSSLNFLCYSRDAAACSVKNAKRVELAWERMNQLQEKRNDG